MARIPLESQIEELERLRQEREPPPEDRDQALQAAIATLRLFQRFEPNVRSFLGILIEREKKGQ